MLYNMYRHIFKTRNLHDLLMISVLDFGVVSLQELRSVSLLDNMVNIEGMWDQHILPLGLTRSHGSQWLSSGVAASRTCDITYCVLTYFSII